MSGLESNQLDALGVDPLKKELDELPEIVCFQLRVEKPAKLGIQLFARANGLTPETLVQGLWEVVESNPPILSAAIESGQQCRLRRLRAGVLKNCITRINNSVTRMKNARMDIHRRGWLKVVDRDQKS